MLHTTSKPPMANSAAATTRMMAATGRLTRERKDGRCPPVTSCLAGSLRLPQEDRQRDGRRRRDRGPEQEDGVERERPMAPSQGVEGPGQPRPDDEAGVLRRGEPSVRPAAILVRGDLGDERLRGRDDGGRAHTLELP